MARPSKRFALFLCLIVLHQDFIQARSSFNEHIAFSRPSVHRRFTEDDDIEEFKNTIQDVESRHNITLRSDVGRPLNRGKRFFGLFIFIVSLIVTVVATVVETIYDIKGCCGIGFGYLCGYEANFERKRNNVKSRAEAVDNELERVTGLQNQLENFGAALTKFWDKVNELVKLEQELLGSIDPAVQNAFLETEKQVVKTLADAKDQLKESAIDVTFNKIGETEKAVKMALSWGTVAIEGAAEIGPRIYKSYKVNQAYKAMKATDLEPLLKASPKAKKLLGFTQGSAKVFLKKTAIAKFASKAKAVFKGLKVFKVAGAALSLLSIGFDLYNIINTFVKCAEKQREAKKACAKVEDAQREVEKAERDVKNFEGSLKSGLEKELVNELKNKVMGEALTHITQTIQGNPPPNNGQPARTWTANCARIIPQFQQMMTSSTDWKRLNTKMNEILTGCLNKQEYAYKCLKARNKMKEKISSGCRRGSSTFEELYREAERLQGATISECRVNGEPYTTKEMFKRDLIEQSNVENLEFYTENCKMNNAIIRDSICKGTAVQGLTPQQIKTVKSEHCKGGAGRQLSPDTIKDICIYKSIPFDNATIKGYIAGAAPDITDVEIDNVQCPAPPQ